MEHYIIGEGFEAVAARAQAVSLLESGVIYVDARVQRGLRLGREVINISYRMAERYTDGATVAGYSNGKEVD